MKNAMLCSFVMPETLPQLLMNRNFPIHCIFVGKNGTFACTHSMQSFARCSNTQPLKSNGNLFKKLNK